MTILAMYPAEWHSSSDIAKSLNINAVLVRNEVKILKAGELVESKEGKYGGVRLLKKAKDIYLSDIFKLIKGKEHVLTFSSKKPNPSCKVGRQINEKLDGILDIIDDSIIDGLKNQTLESFKAKF